MSAADEIRRVVEDHGPITFAEFMELALYGPGGYYELHPVGPHGDFVTSPHVHPVFARLLARAVRELWAALDRPQPLTIAEVGAGDGTLARELARELEGLPLRYTALERSPGARAALEEVDDLVVSEELPAGAHVVLANELLDNLPFRLFRNGHEVRIGLEEGRLTETEAPIDPPLPRAPTDRTEYAYPEAAIVFLERIAGAIRPGYALLIDYGFEGKSGEVHGYRAHRVVEDVLGDPGGTDVTAGVDFAFLAAIATNLGLVALGTVSQRAALLSLGFEGWLAKELDRQQILLHQGKGLEAVRAWGDRSRATLLVYPAALGRLRWWLIASRGLRRPGWWTTAIDLERGMRPPAD